MPTTCGVLKCGSRGDRDTVKFFKLPGELHFPHRQDLNDLSRERRENWLRAIRREDLTEVKIKNLRVCSKHFVSGKPSKLNDISNVDWVPTLLMGYDKDNEVLRKNSIAIDPKERAEKRIKLMVPLEPVPEYGIPAGSKVVTQNELPENDLPEDTEAQITLNQNDKQCQTNITAEDFTQIMLSLESTKHLEAKLNKFEMGYNFLKGNDIKTKYFTGINSFKKVELIFNCIKDFIQIHFNTLLPAFQQFVLTLIKLRLNLDFKALAYLFDISPTTASTYFKNIINIIYDRFYILIKWPERDILKKTMPKCFRETFGEKATVIIDCFELYIEKPTNLLKSAQTWSNYKHHHTIKYLIGVTPQGSISFISEAWGGRASDKHITIHSNFLDKITPGDVILADRGFLIEDHVRLYNAKLEMPAFTKGKKQLHPLEIEKTRSIAHVRIHVERVIGCIRQKFRILSDDMPISLLACGDDDPIVDKIATTCCALINLCPPIVPLE